jgi:hypothetical protein
MMFDAWMQRPNAEWMRNPMFGAGGTRASGSEALEWPIAREPWRRITMPWTIERRHDHVAVVTMNTNKINAQNPRGMSDPASLRANARRYREKGKDITWPLPA